MSLEHKYKEQLRRRDKEIRELKELLAEAESEIKELNNFPTFKKPRPGIMESNFLNKLIKRTAFTLICVVIILVGLYPWLFKNTLLGDEEVSKDQKTEEVVSDPLVGGEGEVEGIVIDSSDDAPEVVEPESEPEPKKETKDIFGSKQTFTVDSDLGWLNVRTEPDVETGDVIKKLNSGEEYEWLEKTDNNWYKVVIDDAGHTGFVSGEYVLLKE